jgi:hypothetical protein
MKVVGRRGGLREAGVVLGQIRVSRNAFAAVAPAIPNRRNFFTRRS